jgi:hypothetical protein
MADMSEDNSLKLVFDEPKQRVKPPQHFADLDPAGRKELALELGILPSGPIKSRHISLLITTMRPSRGPIYPRIFEP